MHWTLLTLLALCGACALFNVISYLRAGSVQLAGILICLAWFIQQSFWWATGHDSFLLFIACDLAIIVWFVRQRRQFNAPERLIAATIPLTTALGFYAWLNDGHTVESWWANYWIVVGQMLFGLPLLDWFWRRVATVNRAFDPWKLFDLRKRATG